MQISFESQKKDTIGFSLKKIAIALLRCFVSGQINLIYMGPMCSNGVFIFLALYMQVAYYV